MAEKVPMTALSPTMEEGTISGWRVKVGDSVATGDVICEVETDKTVMEYEAVQEGTVLKIVVDAGNSARVGQTIAVFGEKGEDISAIESEIADEGAEAAGSAAPAEETPKDEPKGDSADEAQAESRKSSAEDVGPAKSSDTPTTASAPEASTPVASSDGSRIKASPLAVKLAAERNINLALVKGTGTGGRIVRRDIEDFRGVPGGAPAATASTGASAVAAGEDRKVSVAGKRAVIAKRLAESKFSAPHYYVKTSVNMKQVVAARSLLNEGKKEKVSLNAFFIKFVAEALKRHPGVNASWQGDHILEFGSIDIGIAVDLGNGLITPIVRNCGNRGVEDIDTDLKALIEKAGAGTLKPDEYTGATFTISNLGSFGVEEFTAIINPPGAAILALGMTKPTPVVGADGAISVANIMKMTLSCDHRVIDGAAGGRFIFELQRIMEEPLRVIF